MNKSLHFIILFTFVKYNALCQGENKFVCKVGQENKNIEVLVWGELMLMVQFFYIHPEKK